MLLRSMVSPTIASLRGSRTSRRASHRTPSCGLTRPPRQMCGPRLDSEGEARINGKPAGVCCCCLRRSLDLHWRCFRERKGPPQQRHQVGFSKRNWANGRTPGVLSTVSAGEPENWVPANLQRRGRGGGGSNISHKSAQAKTKCVHTKTKVPTTSMVSPVADIGSK